MMKKILVILSFMFVHNVYSQERRAEWLKAGREKQPKYFLKNSEHKLCGLFEDVSAMKIDPKTEFITSETIKITSCLMAKGSIDGDSHDAYLVVDQKEDFLYIKKKHLDENETPFLYAVPSRLISGLWSIRFPEGELMVNVIEMCERMYNWRDKSGQFDIAKEFPDIKDFPFSIQGKGESIRYHVFEYHLGCGT